ncbi:MULTISPECIES: acyl-CoA dehydrogenase family protein [unclassified Haladaptatus]|uniref:acyl-CoA dehydrogenase family protein n=1 Tax=unclassified Haladaptatus TaxID=2622732 RepID=UPI0023E88DF9|nr:MULTISPECIES: acyl-CoA dehydrogenase family protein [unclassified Haladaptatus]
MQYNDSALAQEVAGRVREFMDDVVIPAERELEPGTLVSDSTLADLREQAKEYDIYAPQISEEYGGMGLEFRDVLPAFEEAGRSLLGAPALRVDAPDEGNMHTFEMLGTKAQKDEWLRPLVEGEIHSGFAMTEPIQGGGSDPKMLQTSAEKDGDEWVVNGHKWWTTNGSDASILIVMARTDFDAHPYQGASLILVPIDTPGVEIVRDIPHTGGGVLGTVHSEIKFDDVRVPGENLLGTENMGFTHAQQRLGPARLTHCMRFSGMAQRSLDVAKAYISEREAFGGPIAEKQGPRFAIAEHETKLHAARTMVRHAAWQQNEGDEARIPVSMCKVFTANVAQEAIDTALQFCGANGMGKDLPISDFYEEVRQFRIVDGADEVHKRVIARDAFDEVNPDELSTLTRFDG